MRKPYHSPKVIGYNIAVYLLGVFAITWTCAVILSYVNIVNGVVIAFLDFVESASPLIVCMVLLKPYINKSDLLQFFIGRNTGPWRFVMVAAIFILQFLNFYIFRTENHTINLSGFIMTFIGQIIFGGALEEAGWRGYLQPALEKKLPALAATLAVGVVWSIWHLPYFFLPGSMHTSGNFFVYAITTVITAYILTAIHKLTGSIILCTLFHGWQNTIVMTIPTDMGSLGFITLFVLLGILSLLICLKESRISQRGKKNQFPFR